MYCITTVAGIILALSIACELKRRLSRRSYVQERQGGNTYISFSTIRTDGTDAASPEDKITPVKKTETVKFSTNS